MHPDGKGRLILIRHTESAWNKLNVFTGWVDVPLSEAGRTHALEVGRAMKGKFSVDKAYTSSLVRAQETLDLVMEGAGINGIPIVRDWHLNERFYGNWQSKNKAQTAEKYGENAVHAVRRGYSARPPGGESLEDTTDRVLPYFEETIEPNLAKGMPILTARPANWLRALGRSWRSFPMRWCPALRSPTARCSSTAAKAPTATSASATPPTFRGKQSR